MNIMMLIILIVGGYFVTKINVQFFPDFTINYVIVYTYWPGAAPEDVERSITNRLELDIKNSNNIKEMKSTSTLGYSEILIEFNEGTDVAAEATEIKNVVDRIVPDLPEDAETPIVRQIIRYEPIANLIVSGDSIRQLRIYAERFKNELVARGIGKVTISGLPQEEIIIQVSNQVLHDLGLSLNQIGQRILANSRDTSIGISGRDDAARQLRIIDQRRSEISFEDIAIVADADGSLISLSDIATIEKRAKPDQVELSYMGRPAVEIMLQRQRTSNTLDSADVMNEWLKQTRPTLPPGMLIQVYDDNSVPLKDRIRVLVNNGLAGLVLVLIVLFLFLNTRLAFWVAAGIPVSMLGAMSLLYLLGGSLNMMTLFAFIMTIGIIVDDAIVVAEESLTNYVKNPSPLEAPHLASRRMFMPIVAASLTTIFAFVPVLVVEGVVGSILISVSLVVVCVVATSLLEAFFILPGHLRHSYAALERKSKKLKPAIIDPYFSFVRDRLYRKGITLSVDHPLTVIAISLSFLILTIGLIASGRLNYSFFPTPELNVLWTNVAFSAGTPKETVVEYLSEIEEALYETEAEFGGDLIEMAMIKHGKQHATRSSTLRGSNYGSVLVELVSSDSRSVRTTEFINAWESKLENKPGLENFIVITESAGPPGRDIEVRFVGPDRNITKMAATALIEYLKTVPGVYGIDDDTDFGRQQQILTLTPLGKAMGLTISDISQQLRSAIEGTLLQSYSDQYQDIDVKLTLPDDERNRLSELDNMQVILPSGESVPLQDVVVVRSERGFDTLYRAEGEPSILVSASINPNTANRARIFAHLENVVKPEITSTYDVRWTVGSRQKDQEKTEASMKNGAIIALVLIYLTLAWIFGSYIWPIFVLTAIPFGLVGAAWGHLILGLPFTIITVLGLIGLSGIVVNNAIVLVVFYKQNRDAGHDFRSAMIEAGCQRLRPVVLSSFTTIVGLVPLLFEKSTQAQFLIPMVATLVFGLAFSTLLVMFFVPAILVLYERIVHYFRSSGTEVAQSQSAKQ